MGLNCERVARFPQQSWSHERILKEMRELLEVGRRITVRNLSTKQYSAVLRYFRGRAERCEGCWCWNDAACSEKIRQSR